MRNEGSFPSEKPRDDIETREGEPRFIGRITVLRHGQTRYTNQFPDLTELGTETIERSAEQIAFGLDPEEEISMYSSDQARTQGTASIIKERIGYPGEVRIQRSIGMNRLKDPVAAQEIFDQIIAEEGASEFEKGAVPAVDYAYTHDPRFEDSEIFEPRSDIEKRFFRNLEYTIRGFEIVADKTDEEKESLHLKRPHLIATTHFELLHSFVQRVFNLDYPKDSTLKHGELVEIYVYDHPASGDGLINLIVRFRGEERTVVFDRKQRTLILES